MSELVTKVERMEAAAQPKAERESEIAKRTHAQSASAVISIFERALSNPDVDVDKAERMLAMQERIMDRQARLAFSDAMSAAQAEIQPVARDAYNSHTKSRYARLETISRAINPIITKYGFAMSFGTANSPFEGHYRVTCEVTHCDGHSKQYHVDMPAETTGFKGGANKTPTHAFGSAMSYGRRYLTLLIFNIATEDDDGQAAGRGKSITDEQCNELLALAEDAGADKRAFCEWLGVDSFTAIPANRFDKAKNALQRKKAKVDAGS